MKEIRKHIVRMALENSSWGYCKIEGALKNIGHTVCRSTISKTLKEHGIKPAPDRPTRWRDFIRAHANVIVGADFFTTEVWTARGLVTHYTLLFIEHGSRAVHLSPPTPHPDGNFMANVARDVADYVDGFLRGKRFLIIDRDTKFTKQFKGILEDSGVEIILTPLQAPNAKAFAERFIKSIKRECLDRMIFCGWHSLDRAIREYVKHYNTERPHQGIGNELIHGAPSSGGGEVQVSERLGGLLKFYSRAA